VKIKRILDLLEFSIHSPREGLPEEIFLFVSRITPLINVDLLIKEEGRTLLTWRDDEYCKTGWHVPGGIIRFKEPYAVRIETVAREELDTVVTFDPSPVGIHEIIHPLRKTRGHFISLLFKCRLLKPLNEKMKYNHEHPQINQWKWHDTYPENMIEIQKIYKGYMG
jgi:ADP-ribose pyrophosphatase YjhB (NUDIX family)